MIAVLESSKIPVAEQYNHNLLDNFHFVRPLNIYSFSASNRAITRTLVILSSSEQIPSPQPEEGTNIAVTAIFGLYDEVTDIISFLGLAVTRELVSLTFKTVSFQCEKIYPLEGIAVMEIFPGQG